MEDMAKLNPSPALLVRSETPISECVRMMNEHNVGSVLVVDDETGSQIQGIFTERDLLRKIETIEKGLHWKRPVRTIMSAPVKTLDYSKISQAPKIMLREGFRHLPIVSIDEDKTEHLVGVISMRDLFEILSNESDKLIQSGAPKFDRIEILTQDERLRELLRQVLAPTGRKRRTTMHTELRAVKLIGATDANRRDLLLIDIDDLKTQEWVKSLRVLNSMKSAPYTVIVFDPTKHTPKVVKILERLCDTRRFALFSKPINLIPLFEGLFE